MIYRYYNLGSMGICWWEIFPINLGNKKRFKMTLSLLIIFSYFGTFYFSKSELHNVWILELMHFIYPGDLLPQVNPLHCKEWQK